MLEREKPLFTGDELIDGLAGNVGAILESAIMAAFPDPEDSTGDAPEK